MLNPHPRKPEETMRMVPLLLIRPSTMKVLEQVPRLHMSLQRTSTQPLEKKRIRTTEPEISSLDMSEDTKHSLLCFSGKLTGKDAVFLVDSGSNMTLCRRTLLKNTTLVHVTPLAEVADEKKVRSFTACDDVYGWRPDSGSGAERQGTTLSQLVWQDTDLTRSKCCILELVLNVQHESLGKYR